MAERNAAGGLTRALEQHASLRGLLTSITCFGREWAVVGGAARSWALNCHRKPRDIDIVVAASASLLHGLVDDWRRTTAPHVVISSTAFGGLRLTMSSCVADLWPVESSAGIAAPREPGTLRFRAVAQAAALSLDGVVITRAGTLYERGFVESVRTGILRMNRCEVFRPASMAKKAIRLCEEFGMVPDIVLQAFIGTHLGVDAVRHILGAATFYDPGALKLDPERPSVEK